MKKTIIYLILILLLSKINLYSQFSYQWETSILDPPHEIFKSKFLDEYIGFATALKSSENKSKIIKTVDRGNSWSTVLSWSPYSQYTTFDAYGSNLWVYHQKQIYHSTNYGATWSQNVYDMQNIVGSEPCRQIVFKFFNHNIGYLTYVNSPGYNYATLFIFKTNNGGDSWDLVYTKAGNQYDPYTYTINDFTFLGNDANHVFFVGESSWNNDNSVKGYITLETTDGFNTCSFYQYNTHNYCDNYCYNAVCELPNSPNQTRIFVGKYDYSNPTDPYNGLYCRINSTDYKISNDFLSEQFGGASFSDNNTGYAYIFNKIYKTTNSGINWFIFKDQAATANYCKFRINSIGDIVYVLSYDGYYQQKYLSTYISTVAEYQQSFTGSFSFNGETHYTPFSYYIKGGYNNFSVQASENKMFYKWSDGLMSYTGRDIRVLYDNFNLSINYKTLGKADNEDAIASPNQTKSVRDTNGNINQIYESMGGIFYTRSTDNGASFSTEQIVNSEADGNKNAFISEVKQGSIIYPLDEYKTVVTIWQRREGNNEVIKFASKDGQYPCYSWNRNTNYDITVPTANPFNLQAKCFVQEASYPYNSDFRSVITYLKPNGSNIELRYRTKWSSYVDDGVIDAGNITEYAVARSSQGNYQYLYIAYIKNNEIWYKCWRFGMYGGSEESGNPVDPISLGDGQCSRISPDISLRNGRPVIAYRGLCHIKKCVQFSEEENYLLNYTDYPILVKYKYKNTSNQEVWSTFIPYHSNGVEQKYPNVEGNKYDNAYILNFKFNNQYRQLAQLPTGPGYCSPGQYNLTDAKLVRGSFVGSSYPNSSPKLITLAPLDLSYIVGNQTFTVSNTHTGSISVSDNLAGIIREQNLNYNLNLGPVVVKNTNVPFLTVSETSVTNQMEFNNTMVSAPFSLGPNDTLILDGNGFYNYLSGEAFTQKRFSVFLMRKSTQEPYQTLFEDSIGILDTIETEYLRGFVFDEGMIPEVDSFYVQLVLDSTSLNPGDGDYQICNVYSPDEYYGGDGDNSNTHRRYVHFEKGNNHSNVNSIPKVYSLSQNYPNPFNPVTNIKYQLPKDGFVTLKIYDITGREIARLVNEQKQAGFYAVQFDGNSLASGVYFYRLQTGDFVQVKKMVLIK